MKSSTKWMTVMVLIFGSFMSFLDQTVVTIAIVPLQHAFQVDIEQVQWIVTAYLLTQGALTPTMPFLTALLGRKRCYLFSLVAFTVGSAFCALASNLPLLILFRILQGMGGALLFPLSMSILLDIFPLEERGVALASLGIPALIAPAIGPMVGGFLATVASWHAIFLINVPVGVLAIVLTVLFLGETAPSSPVRFDLLGFLSATYGLFAILYACSEANLLSWGSVQVRVFLLSGILMLALFVLLEQARLRRGKQPLLNLHLLADRFFAVGSIAGLLVFIGLFSNAFLLPIYLQTVRGQSAFQTSILLLPMSLATVISMFFAGKLVDRLGDARRLFVPGLLLQALSIWGLTRLDLTTPYWQLCLDIAILGLANGMVAQPLGVATLSRVRSPEAVAHATTLSTVFRAIAASLGTAVLATLVQARTTAHAHEFTQTQMRQIGAQSLHLQAMLQGFHDVFFITVLLTCLALLFALFLRQKQRSVAIAPLSEALRKESEEGD